MNVLKAYPGIRPLLARAALSMGREGFALDLLDNLEFCDRLLRELNQDPAVPENVQVELYTALLSSGPGGLLAFGWLVSRGHAGPELIQSYLQSLRSGAPRPDGLNEAEANTVAAQLLPAIPAGESANCAGRLLGAVAVSGPARKTILQGILEGAWVPPACRQQLIVWTAGGRIPGLSLPDAPTELFRQGTLARIETGDPSDLVLRQVLMGLEARVDPCATADLALDLVEMYGPQLERSLRLSALDSARQQPDARIRRRAYQLAEPTEGDSFLRLGLRDQDFGVRSWVLARVSRRRAQTA